MSSFTAQYPEYTAPDLAGLNPDIATLRSTLAAFRPYLEKTLREQHGVEPLAIYVYPAQVVFVANHCVDCRTCRGGGCVCPRPPRLIL